MDFDANITKNIFVIYGDLEELKDFKNKINELRGHGVDQVLIESIKHNLLI